MVAIAPPNQRQPEAVRKPIEAPIPPGFGQKQSEQREASVLSSSLPGFHGLETFPSGKQGSRLPRTPNWIGEISIKRRPKAMGQAHDHPGFLARGHRIQGKSTSRIVGNHSAGSNSAEGSGGRCRESRAVVSPVPTGRTRSALKQPGKEMMNRPKPRAPWPGSSLGWSGRRWSGAAPMNRREGEPCQGHHRPQRC